MITGDNKDTAIAIGIASGICNNSENAIEG